ncbi:MAG TPA: caspase family protein, partial [Methylomirabilota bacterium]|nr:caspase family protein [Methylomirabilota bacterium]
ASVLARMETARNRVNLVILDACRDNPFARSFRSATRGLAAIDAPAGTLIAYATAPGRVARDGEGANGLYTGELLKALQAPGQRVEDVFKRVRQAVVERSSGDQVPWESSSLVGEFVFAGRAQPASSTGLAGTTWQGTTSEGDAVEIVFGADGRLRYTALGRQRLASDGVWEQKGAVVVFDVNRYSDWSGVIRGDTIEGSASNRQGARWTWKLLRTP